MFKFPNGINKVCVCHHCQCHEQDNDHACMPMNTYTHISKIYREDKRISISNDCLASSVKLPLDLYFHIPKNKTTEIVMKATAIVMTILCKTQNIQK